MWSSYKVVLCYGFAHHKFVCMIPSLPDLKVWSMICFTAVGCLGYRIFFNAFSLLHRNPRLGRWGRFPLRVPTEGNCAFKNPSHCAGVIDRYFQNPFPVLLFQRLASMRQSWKLTWLPVIWHNQLPRDARRCEASTETLWVYQAIFSCPNILSYFESQHKLMDFRFRLLENWKISSCCFWWVRERTKHYKGRVIYLNVWPSPEWLGN